MGAYDTAATDRLRRELDSEGSCFGMDSVLEAEEGDWGGGERRDMPGEFSGRVEEYEEALEELQGLRHEIQHMENTLQILKPVSGLSAIYSQPGSCAYGIFYCWKDQWRLRLERFVWPVVGLAPEGSSHRRFCLACFSSSKLVAKLCAVLDDIFFIIQEVRQPLLLGSRFIIYGRHPALGAPHCHWNDLKAGSFCRDRKSSSFAVLRSQLSRAFSSKSFWTAMLQLLSSNLPDLVEGGPLES